MFVKIQNNECVNNKSKSFSQQLFHVTNLEYCIYYQTIFVLINIKFFFIIFVAIDYLAILLYTK